MELHGKHLIGGELSAAGRSTFHAVDPVRGQELDPPYREATQEEVDHALRVASRVFPDYRRRSREERAAFLERVAEEIEKVGDDLLRRAVLETALPEARIVGETGRTTSQLRMFAALVREGSWVEARIDRGDPARTPIPKPDVRRMLVPVGPVIVFGASNFPLAFSAAGGDSASALAAGNTVVVKAHPAHPGTSEIVAAAVARAASAAGMPPGVFSLVHGAGHEVGLGLVRHPFARAVGFTGSLRGGRALFDAAAQRPDPIPVFAEMGSINPVFVLPGALRERADAIAEGLFRSVTLGVGQFCTCPGLVVAIDAPPLDAFLSKLGHLLASYAPGTMLHRGILRAYEEGVERLAGTEGVSVLARSASSADRERTQAPAAAFVTAATTFLARPELSEEVFGPSTLVVRCASSEELEDVARGLHGSLTAAVHGTPEDLGSYRWIVDILREKAGRLVANGYPTGVEVCHAMHHGGPYPAATDARSTSVGSAAILRFVRPVAYQDFPQDALPAELRDDDSLGIWRMVDGELRRGAL